MPVGGIGPGSRPRECGNPPFAHLAGNKVEVKETRSRNGGGPPKKHLECRGDVCNAR